MELLQELLTPRYLSLEISNVVTQVRDHSVELNILLPIFSWKIIHNDPLPSIVSS